MLLTNLKPLFRAWIALALLCLSPPLSARAHHTAARTASRPRQTVPGKRAGKAGPLSVSRYERAATRHPPRAAERNVARPTRRQREHKLPHIATRPGTHPGRRRDTPVEPPKSRETIRPVSVVMTAEAEDVTPENVTPESKEENAANIRELYLAHRQASSPSKPEAVVSIIRPAAERPQLLSPQEVAATPEILPSLYDKRGRLVMPAPLRGSHEILLHQNEVADRDGLARVHDDGELDDMRRRSMPVALPVGGGMQVDDRLPANRRFCRPWTASFLAALARAHYARFHTPLQVNSAVRTVATQQRLLRTNGNAAPAAGETASPHLTGQAVDIGKRGLSLAEIAWMRGYLLPLAQEGKIDVEEEFQQSCFHISVYKSYPPVPEEIAVTHRDRPAALAIVLH